MNKWFRLDSGWGITVMRLIMALVIILTGSEKFASGINRVTGSMTRSGIPLPRLAAGYIMTLEFFGGILLLLGLAGRWLGLLYIGEFAVVSFYVLVPTRGWMAARLPIMLLAGALMLVMAGSGRASIDNLLERRRHKASGESAARV